jgi:hypothetical protein
VTEAGQPQLSPLARLLLWDYERGSLAYDLLCVLMLVWMCLPSAWWGDPMAGRMDPPPLRGAREILK